MDSELEDRLATAHLPSAGRSKREPPSRMLIRLSYAVWRSAVRFCQAGAWQIATRKAKVMKNTVLAAAAALVLALSVAPTFAAERTGDNDRGGSSNVATQCDNILASKEGHSPADVRYCENHR